MVVLLALLFFVLPFAELAVIVWVGARVGIPETLGLLLLVSMVGAWLVKRQGLGVWRAVQRRLEAGEMPGREMVDGLLVLLAAALLLTPGFITDFVGVLLLLPPVRAAMRALARRRFRRRLAVRVYGATTSGPQAPGSRRIVDLTELPPPREDF